MNEPITSENALAITLQLQHLFSEYVCTFHVYKKDTEYYETHDIKPKQLLTKITMDRYGISLESTSIIWSITIDEAMIEFLASGHGCVIQQYNSEKTLLIWTILRDYRYL